MTINTEITEKDDGSVYVKFTETLGEQKTTITGWPEAAEDLGLLGSGPKEANGIKVIEEEPRYHGEDKQEDVAGYTMVILFFEDKERLKWASDRLHDKATERFEWGMSEANEVQKFAGAIPRVHTK